MSYTHDDQDPLAPGAPGASPNPDAQVPSWRAAEDDEPVMEMPTPQIQDGVSGGLSERLRGYDPLPGDAEHVRETRLCSACSMVGPHVDGRCLNCGFKAGASSTAAMQEAEEIRFAAEADGGSTMKWVAIGLLVVLLVVAGIYVIPMLTGGDKDKPIEGEPAAIATPSGQPAATDAASDHPGTLDQVQTDDTFYSGLEDDIIASNKAWEQAGVKAFAYRYNVLDTVVPAVSQTLALTIYVAGDEAEAAISAPKDAAFLGRIRNWINQMGNHEGVSANVELRTASPGETIGVDDRYVVYGHAWGKDHQEEIDKVVAALESYKSANGEYPLELDPSMTGGLKTRGNLNFEKDGVGYLPIFRTDGAGNIKMGEGKGLDAFQPEAATGYYLFFFVESQSAGLDVYGKADVQYYTDKISPFPYKPEGPLHNVKLNPDNTPDGVACMLKDGKLI